VVAAVLVSSGFPRGATGQEPLWGGKLVAKIDSLAAATLLDGRVSGFSVGVARGNAILMVEGYGFADLDNLVHAGPHTVYRIGSITKQFTAAAIMQLVDRGAIRLDDPLTRFMPDYPDPGQEVTIRHLLTHTSGIRSYPSDDTPLETLAHDLSDSELKELIQAEPFEFTPGEAFRYSNAGYVLLGMIVASASGQSYPEYLTDHVFEPVGLGRTAVCDPSRITPGAARGYALEDGMLRHASYLSMSHAGAAGALCASVFDLLSWTVALKDGRVVTRASYEAMKAPAELDDGSQVPYGFGLRPQPRLEGQVSVSHGGGINGFSSQLDHFPEFDLTIAVASNTYGSHVRRISDAIARWALGIPMPAVLDEPQSARELEAYVGRYRLSDPDRDWTVFQRDGWLFVTIGDGEPSRLRSQGDHTFAPQFNDFARVTFVMQDGRATGISLHECVPVEQSRCRTRQGSRMP
jgi:D-alanyl-D-alanine carboxypeptidase